MHDVAGRPESRVQDLYRIASWGLGYFSVTERGHLAMRPNPDRAAHIDVKALVDDIQRRGLELPVLLRFTDLVRARIDALVDAFHMAFADYEYRGAFRGVYPVKVNQQRQLVEEVVHHAKRHHLGLEAGSKPELLVTMSLLDDPEALIVCNGYKDSAYIELALQARKLGHNCIIVIEKFSELQQVLRASERLGIRPVLGLRAKLSTTGAGRWRGSVGDQAKFGLTIPEIIASVKHLQELDLLDTLQLLHFHIGSQVSAIRAIKNAMREAMRIYTELAQMGANMRYLDVGGGLGVDYDGSRTTGTSSMNYDVQEYANDVVAAAVSACDDAGVPHPDLVTESGRFMVTHSSMLVFNVVGTSGPLHEDIKRDDETAAANKHLTELWEIFDAITPANLQEPFHDAVEIREEVTAHFQHGLCSLVDRAEVDALFWAVCAKLSRMMRHAHEVPSELLPIQRSLAHTYFCNFSLFQSAPDSWAIQQLFPVCPIHRLDEPPSVLGVLADITCDSDGKVDRFIGKTVKPVLELHPLGDEPYLLGMFLVGSYQEILGDLHNLFGDTHIVHVSMADTPHGYRIEHVVEGDTVKEVLQYVEFDRQHLVARIRRAVEASIEKGICSIEEGARLMEAYRRELEGYTYLETRD